MFEKQIQMVDLHGQYHRLKEEIDTAMQTVIESSAFINGPQVKTFGDHLAGYLEIPYVIPCGNGTDALQIALMALELQPGDEVIVPAFTYVAAAEVIALLGLTPVLVDVDPQTFNLDPQKIEGAISRNTKAIIAVHLFGQSCDMEPILQLAKRYHLYVIEDNAQSIGAEYTFADGHVKKTGTMGVIGTTSFFPSKPLACYGDGGALMTSDEILAKRIRMIANHGQERKYHHKLIGCNSRLDTLQAAVLDVKLKHIDEFTEARRVVAGRYDEALASCDLLIIPKRSAFSTHVYHQYTIQLKPAAGFSDMAKQRELLQSYLKEKGIPSMVYYPLPLQAQDAYKWMARTPGCIDESARLSKCVLSLPIHTEMSKEEQEYIIDAIVNFKYDE
ncbi:DegT/DnrJ/EryC1/StrS family aminotransferase [Parabacteroides gordonii]|uniref:DegT/DnrJ/EryC1/StrS family aminotransferase n=1 Tax=Parabacteroides gordonii TaxID=574930 RepID=UPI000EE948B0|nr:DegT/DnrJ/EryC1/StrS family aminotransferase [Parabacteroides gordonii]RGP17374.1 DegT/DnrJ/EryC1/StrS family aminotransferase [Parabacteroides gordonii]